jgi:hypothetical protein
VVAECLSNRREVLKRDPTPKEAMGKHLIGMRRLTVVFFIAAKMGRAVLSIPVEKWSPAKTNN